MGTNIGQGTRLDRARKKEKCKKTKFKMSSKTKKKPKSANKESTDDSVSDKPGNSEDMEAKFEQELVWCIEQLQLGLETHNPNSRQAVEGTKALKILLSSKAPMIKKRQVMRNTFGDYRKKMAKMEQSSTTAARKGTIAPAVTKTMQKSTFFKKSATRNSTSDNAVLKVNDIKLPDNQSENCNDNNSVTQSGSTEVDAELNSSFHFNFKIEDKDTPDGETSSANTGQLSEDVHVGSVNMKSDNSFRFNFMIPS